MKKLAIIFFLMTAVMHSQDKKFEKIKALKTAYITEQLALTSSEAEKFWPVYNNFDSQFQKLRHRKHHGNYEDSNVETKNLSDTDANKLIDEYLSIEATKLELQKQKITALRKVISPQKIISLRKAEDDFKHELLNRYRRGRK